MLVCKRYLTIFKRIVKNLFVAAVYRFGYLQLFIDPTFRIISKPLAFNKRDFESQALVQKRITEIRVIQQNVFRIGIRLVTNGIANDNLVFLHRKMPFKRDIFAEKRGSPFRAENLGAVVRKRNVNVFRGAVM